MMDLRTAIRPDFESIVRLNQQAVQHTSPMDLTQLVSLAQLCAYCKVATVDGEVAAFLLALREDAAYENVNHAWFRSHVSKFLYVDRIVVGPTFAGRGIGRRLYEDMFAFARRHDVGTIACEYNIEPPNEASRAFHNKFGFREMGTHWVAGGTKRVTLQVARP